MLRLRRGPEFLFGAALFSFHSQCGAGATHERLFFEAYFCKTITTGGAGGVPAGGKRGGIGRTVVSAAVGAAGGE